MVNAQPREIRLYLPWTGVSGQESGFWLAVASALQGPLPCETNAGCRLSSCTRMDSAHRLNIAPGSLPGVSGAHAAVRTDARRAGMSQPPGTSSHGVWPHKHTIGRIRGLPEGDSSDNLRAYQSVDFGFIHAFTPEPLSGDLLLGYILPPVFGSCCFQAFSLCACFCLAKHRGCRKIELRRTNRAS